MELGARRVCLIWILGLGISNGCGAPSPTDETAAPGRLVFAPEPEDGGGPAVVVTGLSSATLAELRGLEESSVTWPRHLLVATAEELSRAPNSPTPMLGRYVVEDDRIIFRPRFPFSAGRAYVARWRREASPPIPDLEFSLPAAARRTETRVLAVHPSGDVLPENLLRLYIRFSAPMSRGEATRRIRLLDEEGQPVPEPFLQIPQELWNGSGDRLTILLDPGRIKREVGPHQVAGPPLREGRSYRLIIDPEWLDGCGAALAEGFEKIFRVGPPDRSSPAPETWAVGLPEAPGEPLTIGFPAPLDYALALRLIRLEDEAGKAVAGSVTLDDEETLWRFHPAQPLPSGEYSVVAEVALEDPSGNSLRRPFETTVVGDEAGGEAGSPPPPPTRLPISIP